MNLESIERELQKTGLDGWLFFDHHERGPLAYRVLGLKPPGHVSRRCYYFIPARGEPLGLVHQVEPHGLNPWSGAKSKRLGCGSFCKTQERSPCNTRPGATSRMWPTWRHVCNYGEEQ